VTVVAPGIDRGRDRRDTPRQPERPEAEGVYRWDDSTRTWSTYTIYPDTRWPSDEGRDP